MDEKPTLQEMLNETIGAFCAENGFGIPTGFVYCVSRIADDGQQVLTLGCADGQATTLSMGLTAYLAKSFELDAESELSAWYAAMYEDDE